MEIGGLYQFVLIIILTGMLVGVGVLALDKFQATTGLTTDAVTAINNSKQAVASVSNTWMGLIVTIGVLAIIIGLVIGGFYLAGRR
jgi:hypothetical protein